MITRIRKQLFSLRHTYRNPLDAQRARVLLLLNIAIVMLAIAAGCTGLFLSLNTYGT